MTLSRRYYPADHDQVLFNKWKRGLDDYEISADFMRQGLNFSVITISEARRRLKLQPNKRPERIYHERDKAAPQGNPDPLAVAQRYLPGFDKETMTVYGKPRRLNDVMRETNLVLKTLDMGQVDANPLWVV